jgi:hypothetical protein
MSAGLLFVLWKGVLGFGLPIALGLWELHRLRRYREEDAGDDPPPVEPEPATRPPAGPKVAVPPRAPVKVPELV